ncbi:unnamed protein product, partial [Scytosiphon promiscuus]
PVSAAALSRLLRQGEVDGMTMAWSTGMGDWKPLGEVRYYGRMETLNVP